MPIIRSEQEQVEAYMAYVDRMTPTERIDRMRVALSMSPMPHLFNQDTYFFLRVLMDMNARLEELESKS